MRSIMGWLGEPYIHVFVISIALVQYAIKSGPTDPIASEQEQRLSICPECGSALEPDLVGAHARHHFSPETR